MVHQLKSMQMADSPLSEAALVRRCVECQDGDERQRLLDALLAPYIHKIRLWTRRQTRDHEEAADMEQDVLLSLCTRLGTFRGEARFSTWLFTVVRNQTYKTLARRHKQQELTLRVVPTLIDSRQDLDSRLERKHQIDRLRVALTHALSPLEAKIFLLHYGAGVPLSILDRRLGLKNRSGSRAHLLAAKRKLRQRMVPQDKKRELLRTRFVVKSGGCNE